jgi:hypothetical protein
MKNIFLFFFFYLIIIACNNKNEEKIVKSFPKIQDSTYYNVTEVKQYELDALRKLNLPFPKSVRRFYLTENGITNNFFSECVYEKNDGLVASTYIFLKVSFLGDSNNLMIKYDQSAGRMSSGEGVAFKSSINNFIDIQETYGTGASVIQVSENGKSILNKVSNF